MRLAKAVNVQIGRKLTDKSKDEIMKAVFDCFSLFGVIAVQIGYDIVRVSFTTNEGFKHAMENSGIRLFGLWCPILGGGPPLTTLHIFDYTFEEDDSDIKRVRSDFGEVKNVKKQKYISDPNIFTGTRLVSVALSSSPPRFLTIGGYQCRVWYKGQPLVCNLCAVQGHKSADCPNKDKCRRCGASGHFACNCTNAWNTGPAPDGTGPGRASGENNPSPEQSPGYTSLASISETVINPLPVVAGEDPPAPSGASGASGDSHVSPSDRYNFTCGQPVESSTGSQSEVSDSQCIAAEARVTAGLVNNVDDANSQTAAVDQNSVDENIEDDVVETIETNVDEGDASPASQSILQNVGPSSSGASSGSASLGLPPPPPPVLWV